MHRWIPPNPMGLIFSRLIIFLQYYLFLSFNLISGTKVHETLPVTISRESQTNLHPWPLISVLTLPTWAQSCSLAGKPSLLSHLLIFLTTGMYYYWTSKKLSWKVSQLSEDTVLRAEEPCLQASSSWRSELHFHIAITEPLDAQAVSLCASAPLDQKTDFSNSIQWINELSITTELDTVLKKITWVSPCHVPGFWNPMKISCCKTCHRKVREVDKQFQET